jgi:hypothetical protein
MRDAGVNQEPDGGVRRLGVAHAEDGTRRARAAEHSQSQTADLNERGLAITRQFAEIDPTARVS